MRILLNAVSAKMGGAANYIYNVARELARLTAADEFIFLVPEAQAARIRELGSDLRVITAEFDHSCFWRRLWFDQIVLRGLLRREQVDVLFSTANFGMVACPRRQVLLVRNILYFSRAYLSQVMPHKSWRTRVEITLRRWLNCQSVRAADVVMTPTRAMLDEVREFVQVSREKALVNYYGVDQELFRSAREREDTLKLGARPVRLLFTSLYGEHKNFVTLLRALLELSEDALQWQLITTADPSRADARWTCTWKQDSRLAADPRIRSRIRFIAELDRDEVAKLYRAADIFVYPAMFESFGHPLVEALASGLPIIAADVPVNRELAGDAAIYFEAFDPHDLAQQIRRLIHDEDLRRELMHKGLKHSRQFRWSRHVERLRMAFSERFTESERCLNFRAGYPPERLGVYDEKFQSKENSRE